MVGDTQILNSINEISISDFIALGDIWVLCLPNLCSLKLLFMMIFGYMNAFLDIMIKDKKTPDSVNELQTSVVSAGEEKCLICIDLWPIALECTQPYLVPCGLLEFLCVHLFVKSAVSVNNLVTQISCFVVSFLWCQVSSGQPALSAPFYPHISHIDFKKPVAICVLLLPWALVMVLRQIRAFCQWFVSPSASGQRSRLLVLIFLNASLYQNVPMASYGDPILTMGGKRKILPYPFLFSYPHFSQVGLGGLFSFPHDRHFSCALS